MPSLFNRRSRSVSTSRPTTPASNSAHLAAAQAFLSNQSPQSKLSASAAAAALRTMSPTPTPVDQVQTKRMLSRQSSTSSTTNATRGRSGGGLQRRPSGGSMTERTFRSPSPGRPGSQTDNATSSSGETRPPVPPLPQTYDNIPPIPPKSHRRSASVETPPSLTTKSKLPASAGRGQSVDRNAPVTSPAAAAARRSVSAQQPVEMQRSDSQDSRNSFNFSYPRGTRPSSPPPKSPLGSNGVPSSIPATNGISASETRQIQNNLIQTAAKPVKKKKKKVDQSAAEGSHLQAGTMGAKPIVTPLETIQPEQQPQTQLQPVRKSKKKATLSGQSTHFPDGQESSTGPELGSDSDNVASPATDRRAKRASGLLMKQPSVVREDWEGEQEEAGSSPIQADTPEQRTARSAPASVQPVMAKKPAPEANMSRKIGEPASTSRSAPTAAPVIPVHEIVNPPSARTSETSMTLAPDSMETSIGRGTSVSPSRSTRFSDRLASDLAAGRKHEPLGRSISPAKSALKHTASEASPSDLSFPQRRDSSVTPSEASDVSASGMSRKKSTRVSFEALPQVIDPVSDTQTSRDTGKKGWFGLGKNKSPNQSGSSTINDVEEGMKPRPALPSFGSVRRSERSVSPAVPEVAVGGTPNSTQSASSSETSSIADPPTMETSISSDHAIGGVLFKEAHKSKEPLPPQVTSVEGSGYVSDTDSLSSNDEVHSFHAAQQASKQLGDTIRGAKTDVRPNEPIPVIAVQPATPGLDESQPTDEWVADVPGGFPEATASDESPSEAEQAAASPGDSAGLGIYKSAQDNASNAAAREPPSTPAAQLTTIAEEDSDNSSLYSDAAEDLSDLEGDGFGSINAIVESPVVTSPHGRGISPPESPLDAVSQKKTVEPERTASWDDTQAHWSGLAQRFRDSQSSTSQPPAAPLVAVKTGPMPQKKAKKKKTQSMPVPTPAAASVTPSSKPTQTVTPRAQVETSVSTRATNQRSVDDAADVKRSPVSKTQGHLRTSMRGEPESVVAPPRQRPVSAFEPPPTTRTTVQKKSVPDPAPPKILPRRFSNDSDSDSSFKRARRRAKPADGKYTMKRSMRAGPVEQERPAVPAGRGGVRSMSPTDRRPLSPTGARTMRTSMRGSVDTGVPTLRGQQDSKRSSSLFSRNRKVNMSPTGPSTTKSAIAKMKSRIADSDDEDGPRPTHFASRFADSSDEDEPERLRPVRGIPRKKDDGDSTDLDDSSDDQGRKPKSAPAQKKLTIDPPPPTEEVASPPLSPTTAKKRGLWGRLRNKKKDEVDSDASQNISQPVNTEVESKAEKVSKDAKQLGFRSDAERDALIEQTRLKLEAAQERPTSPPVTKSQRRLAPHRVLSDSWAQPRMSITVDDRPNTSGNINGKTRPEMGDRQASEMGLVDGESGVQGKSGKKKKFALLRKAFGLTD